MKKIFAIMLMALMTISVAAQEKKSCCKQEPTAACERPDSLKCAKCKKEVAIDRLPTVTDFTASWCGPCRVLAPILERVEKKFEGRVAVRRVDIDDNRAEAEANEIKAVPTLIFTKLDGTSNRIEGLPGLDESVIEAVLTSAFQSLLE